MQEHSACLLKENGSERLHGTIDIIPSHFKLFTAADLSSPSHRVPLFTPRAHVPILNIRIERMLRWRNIFLVEQYSSKKFSECRPKIFPLLNNANYGIGYTEVAFIIASQDVTKWINYVEAIPRYLGI